jgi:hypothetical protein
MSNRSTLKHLTIARLPTQGRNDCVVTMSINSTFNDWGHMVFNIHAWATRAKSQVLFQAALADYRMGILDNLNILE